MQRNRRGVWDWNPEAFIRVKKARVWVIQEKLGVGVQHDFQNPYPIYDQNLRFFFYPIYDLTKNLILPYLWGKKSLQTSQVTHQCRNLSRFLQHEATRNNSTPPWMGYWSVAGSVVGLSTALNSPVPIYMERGTVKVKCLAKNTKYVISSARNPDHTIRSRVH